MQTPESSPDRKSRISSLTQKSWRTLRNRIPALSLSPKEESRGQFVVLSSSINAELDNGIPHSPDSQDLGFAAAGDNPELVEGNAVTGAPAPLNARSVNGKGSEIYPLSLSGARVSFGTAPLSPPLEIIEPLKSSAGLAYSVDGGDQTAADDVPPQPPLRCLGAPFDETEFQRAIDSDSASAFSFNRQMSRRYYKDVMEPPSNADASVSAAFFSHIDSYASYGSFRSYVSNESYVSDIFYRSDYGGSGSGLSWEEDISHLEEPDYLSHLITEVNEILSDEDVDFSVHPGVISDGSVRRTNSAPDSSIHRQLSIILDEQQQHEPVLSFFKDPTPKRAKSTISTHSSVWPIQE